MLAARGEIIRRTATGEAPKEQAGIPARIVRGVEGVTTKNTGNTCASSNEAPRDASAVECRLTTDRSSPRVKLVVHHAKTRLEHVRVDFCGRHVGVAEHHLDGAQVGAALEKMRRERMS